MQKRILQFSGFSGAIAVSLGALAAHGLKSKYQAGLISESNLQAFETAARYQLYHSITLLVLVLFFDKLNTSLLIKTAYCFMLGIILFSGSLYILSTAPLIGLTNIQWLGPITPIGGIFFIAGWVTLAFNGIRSN